MLIGYRCGQPLCNKFGLSCRISEYQSMRHAGEMNWYRNFCADYFILPGYSQDTAEIPYGWH